MPSLPTGTVTFFFSDIEGSTRLLEALGADYADVLERHRRIVRETFSRSSAVEVGTQGDSFFAVFASATEAVAAAVAIQRAIAAETWPHASALRVRIGLHTGEGRVANGDYVGIDVHRAARIASAAHGGQILISEATGSLVARSLPEGVAIRDLGEHRLRDLSAPERLLQVVADGLTDEFPAPATLDYTRNNLPTQTSDLVGRDTELRAIHDHLDSPGVRLVTLTGPGGIGKTRLALQAAADHIDRFADGVYFIDLSAVRDAQGALEAMVQAIGVKVSGEDQLRAALAEQLGTSELLLVLDNFEQVMEAADDVVELLRQCARLRILVTSREPLRVRGEQVIPVEPLSPFEAVRLFVERAQQVRPDFVLTDDNAAAVGEICTRLDGLPLAIELAAARLRLFSPNELRDRLHSRLELLRGGARDLPPRQRTLRSTIEWSYELLDDGERGIFQLLSVFSSARLDAVEDVAARCEPTAKIDVVERLASLVDKSLIRSTEEAGGRRLSMLETIREYAIERLASHPEMALAARRAHAESFADFAQGKRDSLRGPGREGALDELESELGNLQAAWRYCADAGDAAELNRLLDALWALYDARGWYHGAVGLTNDLLEVLSRSAPTADRVDDEITLRMSLARGLLALRGYTEEAEGVYRQALALAGEAAVPKRLPVLRSLATFHLYRGELDQAANIGREVLALAEEEHDTSVQVEGHLVLGPALAFLGDPAGGIEHLDRAVALFDPVRHGPARFRLGPNPGVAAYAVSGLLRWMCGYPDAAAARAARALELATQIRHPYTLAYATFHVTLLDLWSRRLEVANERARDILDIAEEHDYRIWRALGLVLQGVTEAALGRPDAGLSRTEQGIALYENLRTPPIFWPNILSLRAEALALAGRPAEAVGLVDQAIALNGGGNLDSAGLLVQRGDLLFALGDVRGAEGWFVRAFDDSDRFGARMSQLRAATRLARLGANPRGRDARSMLRETLDWFTEGFDAPDLVDARAALDELTAVRR